MKNMTVKISGLAVAVFLALPVISTAQGMGQSQGMGQGSGMGTPIANGDISTPPNKQNPPTQNPPAQNPPAAAASLDPKEEDAIKKLRAMQSADPKDIVKTGDSFMKAYPKSNYLETVYSILAAAYMQLDDQANMFKYGNMALGLNPGNIDALAVMTVATARRIDSSNAPDARAKEKQVEAWGGTCIDQLNKLTKPEGVSDADFARSRDGKMAMCYSGLGLAVYNEGKVEEAVKDFSAATKLEGPQPDPVDLYLLGVSLTDSHKYSEAVAVLQQCMKDSDQRMVPLCQKELDNAKKGAAAAPKK